MARPSSDSYGRFATYYDFIYHDLVNYVGDVEFLEAVFRCRRRRPVRSILDLGCGTGNHDVPLASRGYTVTGLDRSAPQLAVARRKGREAGVNVRFVRGDMRSFQLPRSFDAAICMFGAFGYLTRSSDVLRCLRTVRRHLQPDGLFIYEFWHTPAVRPQQSWLDKPGDAYEVVRLSESRFDRRRSLLTITFRFFVFHGRRMLDRFDETHTIRTFTVPEMRDLLARGGFRLLGAYAATNEEKQFRPPRSSTFRVMAVAQPKQS